jgi:hypothetical protein
MLPPFIIEQIRQREEQQRQQPVLELPLEIQQPARRPPHASDEPVDDEPQRGVLILDLG